MILAYAVLILAGAALLLGRDLSAIGRRSYRGGWILASVVAGLFVLQAGLILYVPGQTTLQMILLISSQVALAGFAFLNWHVPGAKVFALGVGLNISVMIANGGWMPVTQETYQFVHPGRTAALYSRPPSSKNIILPRSETNLWVLSDIIRLPLLRFRTAISLGDVLLIFGVGQFIFQTTSTEYARTDLRS